MTFPWNEATEEIVRVNYPKLGSKGTSRLLEGSTPFSVKKRANKLGVRFIRETPNQSTEHMDRAIERLYQKHRVRGDVRRFADGVGKTRSWVSNRAVELGLIQPGDIGTEWSAAELDFVARHPRITANSLSKRMQRRGWKRTPAAIQNIRKKREMDREDIENFSASEAGFLLGVSPQLVINWISSGLLQAKRRDDTERGGRGNYYIIREAHLADFIVRNPHKIDLTKIEKNKTWFIDFMARCAAPARLDGGSVQERAVMLRDVRPDLTSEQIADMIGSTRKSVDVMISRARAETRKEAA